MKLQILPPDKAKKDAQAKLAAWKRQRDVDAAKGAKSEPDKANLATRAEKPKPLVEEPLSQEKLNKEFVEAAEKDDLEKALSLIQSGADINARCMEMNALMWASHNGNAELAAVLIRNNADVNARNRIDYTPLMFAAQDNYIAVAELLLQNGADTNVVNSWDYTALSLAMKRNHEVMELLLRKHGATE
jgi:ankyrin repeat protein